MNQLLDASAQFPTVIFSIGLGVCLVYWLFVLLGALDIDTFGDAAGVKGGVEGLKGIKIGHDADADVDGGGIWHSLGLSAVPITISISAIMFVCWLGSIITMRYAGGAIGNLGGWLPGLILLGVIIIGVPLAGVLVRPLGPVFDVKEGKSNRDYVGHTCTINTGHVDDGFGQATIEDGGTVLVIPVRCDRKDALRRGDKALVIDFDDARAAYVVEPTAEALMASPTSGEAS